MVVETVALRADEVVVGRPFTAVDMTKRDRKVLNRMLSDVRMIVAEVVEGVRVLEPFQKLAWKERRLTHRLLICDVERLRAHQGLCVVGFFAERRTDLDIAPLEAANSEMVSEFDAYPGILSYGSVELPGGHWGNLVLHDDPVDTEYWRQSRIHSRAVETLSPIHYANVRIHRGRLTSGLFDRPSVAIERTKYYDYSGSEPWRAERPVAAAR